MKRFLYALLVFALCNTVQAQTFQDTLIIDENFGNPSNYTDLTELLIWGPNSGVQSGFQYGSVADNNGLAYYAVHMTPTAMQYAGYQPNTIRASQAIDFRFPEPISREQDSLIIEFDALWDVFNSNGWGESGRIVLTLLHDYPEDGIPFGAIDDLSEEAPFGRPAYNMRLRNTENTGAYQSGGLMLYGGGIEYEGEIEQAFGYWLPGFSSEAGGGTPGQGDPYPLSPTQKNEGVRVATITNWKHYTWVIAPNRLSFYQRDADMPESANELVMFMETPRSDQFEGLIVDQLNEAHGTSIDQAPLLYHWFEEVEALRLYFRGVNQAYLANLEVHHRYEGQPVSTTTPEIAGDINVFPNPAYHRVYIDMPGPKGQALDIQLFNDLGMLVHQGIAQDGNASVDVSQLPSGVYHLVVNNQKERFTRKVIVH